MSEYERKVEEALARKARESETGRKTVQSEEQLINSLNRLFSENSAREKKPAADSRFAETAEKNLEKQLVESSHKKEPERKLYQELERDLAKNVRQAATAERDSRPDLNEQQASSESDSEEVFRFYGNFTNPVSESHKGPSIVFAVLLAIFLAAAGISGGLYYALFTYQPMADAVNNSECVSVLEDDFLAVMNEQAGESGITFTREMLIGGQTIRDIKSSLSAAYNGGTFSPDCSRMSERIEAAAGNSRAAAALSAKAGEYYSSMIAAAPEASWFGQTGSLHLFLLVVLTAGVLGSIIMLLFLLRQKRGSNAAGFAFAGSAILLEVISIIVMITGVFRRYEASYSYITVLSTRYMLGGIIACMAIGAFYMMMAVEAALIRSK